MNNFIYLFKMEDREKKKRLMPALVCSSKLYCYHSCYCIKMSVLSGIVIKGINYKQKIRNKKMEAQNKYLRIRIKLSSVLRHMIIIKYFEYLEED